MVAFAPDLSDIDAAIAKGEGWLRLLEELAEAGVALARELAPEVSAGRIEPSAAADLYGRISAAVRQAIAMSVRLEEGLRGLVALRACSAQEISDARARAFTQAKAEAAARDRAREQARARREARREQVRGLVLKVIEEEATDREAHENLSLALEARLSFDPAWIDIDALPLRETVARLCAALGITPDWSRWEAEHWKPRDPRAESDWPTPSPDRPPPVFAGNSAATITLARLE